MHFSNLAALSAVCLKLSTATESSVVEVDSDSESDIQLSGELFAADTSGKVVWKAAEFLPLEDIVSLKQTCKACDRRLDDRMSAFAARLYDESLWVFPAVCRSNIQQMVASFKEVDALQSFAGSCVLADAALGCGWWTQPRDEWLPSVRNRIARLRQRCAETTHPRHYEYTEQRKAALDLLQVDDANIDTEFGNVVSDATSFVASSELMKMSWEMCELLACKFESGPIARLNAVLQTTLKKDKGHSCRVLSTVTHALTRRVAALWLANNQLLESRFLGEA